MAMPPQGQHWLVDIARRAALTGADTLDVPASAPLHEVWPHVARHCGVSEEVLAQEAADLLRVPLARLDAREPHVTRFIPEKIARRFRIVPLRENDRQLVIATSDPIDEAAETGIAFASGRTPIFELASPAAIAGLLERAYAKAAVPAAGADEALGLVQRTNEAPIGEEPSDESPVVRLVQLILRNAAQERASDVHLEPGPGGGTVRFRVDGVMRVHMRMPMLAFQRAVSRIKVLSGMDIADRLHPQDGRAGFEHEGRTIDLRISTVPTRETEKCVIRLLRGGSADKLADLDIGDADRATLRHLISHRNGVVIVTGPTGSGKTTTLYALIRELDNGETNISTVEDPIEYDLPGITQMQVEHKREFTFASALRAILRQDPDVILVGEVRDLETAEIAVQASMTGHLVLTTLHTNDAVGAIARLVDIGVERPALAATVRGVVAQRLMRRICPDCHVPVTELDADERALAERYGVRPVVRAAGCDRCGQTGYRGRMAIHEILLMQPGIQELVASGASGLELQRAAIQSGMSTLRQAALQRVADGSTTLQEVDRVIGDTAEAEAPAASPAAPSPAAASVASAPSAASAPVRAMSGGGAAAGRVLLVEDDAVCRRVARHLLEQADYEVVDCVSGEEALALVAVDEQIGLVVLDLGLPGMPGDEVLRRLRGSAGSSTLPVLVLTGSPDPDLEVRLMEEGADDYIRKPLEPKRFVARVKAALRRAAAA